MIFRLSSCVFSLGFFISAQVCLASLEMKVTTATGNGADSSVREDEPNTNFGSHEELSARFNDLDILRNRYTILRFDLSAVKDLSQVKAAFLQLYDMRSGVHGTAVGTTFDIWLLDEDSQDDWSESQVTWVNSPWRLPDSNPYNGPDFGPGVRF